LSVRFLSMCYMRMCDPIRIKGWWFLPESANERVPGVMTWSQVDGVDLELIGGIHANAKQGVEDSRTGDDLIGRDFGAVTIFGETDAGRPVSLWNTERHKYTGDALGNAREEFWHGPWACIGAHIPSVDAAELHDPVVALDNLYYLTDDGRFCAPPWATIVGVDHPQELQADGTYLWPYVLPVVGGLKANIAVGATSVATYRVQTHATRPWISPATEAMPDLKLDFMTERRRSGPSIRLSVGAHVRMEHSAAAWSAQDMLDAMNPLSALMRLATFADNGVEFLSARTGDEKQVSLLCQLGHESQPEKTVEAAGLVFDFSDVDLASFMSSWDKLTNGPQATYAWNVVTGMISHSPKLVEEGVSQVLAGAEGFHTWCLDQGQDVLLRDRLVSLHSQLDQEVSTVLGLDVDRWVDWAVWARNHVDHGGAKKHRDHGDILRLKAISDTVRLVTYLVALGELSVPAERVVTALREHPRLQILAGRCQDMEDLPAHETLQTDHT